MNSECQLKYWRSKPETAGPSAGHNVMIQTHNPIIEPRFSDGVTIKAEFIIIGMSIPVPNAWIILEINSAVEVLENTAHRVPIKNNIIALKNSCFVVKVWIRKAVTGTRIPTTNT